MSAAAIKKKVLLRGATLCNVASLSLFVYGQTFDAIWVRTVLVRERRKCDDEPQSELHFRLCALACALVTCLVGVGQMGGREKTRL